MRAFVIIPFGTKRDLSGFEIDFNKVKAELIDPALKATDFSDSTTGELIEAGNIREDIFELIVEADLVICDITISNANVFYELGIRHALRKKRTLLIKCGSAQGTPFDLHTDRYLRYAIDDLAAANKNLTAMIQASLASDRLTDSPIFQMLPSLSEADSAVRVVPQEFREEVDRAQKAGAKGLLRLLAEEVRGLRFEMNGLMTVARAQWFVHDYDCARHSWEKIREVHPNDIEANLALANIYERLYFDSDPKDPMLMEKSDQAITQVLDNPSATRADRIEALALQGSNRKNRWRLKFDNFDHMDERRAAAINRALIESYESYRDAFQQDLNRFYLGLNALRMGTILLDLSGDESWFDEFASDREADAYRVQLEHELSSLRQTVPSSIEATFKRMDDSDPEHVWARISIADVLFLASD